MISRLRRAAALLIVSLGVALLAVACQKVPLLAPSGSTITLTSAATALPANGSTDVIAQVIEASGTPPHSGTLVTFTTNLGTVQPSEAETDISGRVTVKYLAGAGSGTATITAISGGVSASGTSAIKIAVGAAAVGGVGLSANPTSLPATGGTTTVTAAVTDTGGNPLAGVPVTFSTDNGALATSVVTTDTKGIAQTKLTTSRTSKVTATAGIATSSGGTTPTTTGASTNTVTINVNAAATVVFGAITPTAPVAGQSVTFTLTVTPAATGAAIQNVVVNFGDGRSQTLGAISGVTSLSHTYDSAGTYTLSATATDSNGDSFPGASTVTIGNRLPANVQIVAAPVSPQVGVQVAFTITTTFPGSTTTFVQSVAIDFGDGSSAQPGAQSVAVAQHVYSTAGTYVATAVVRDSAGGTASSQTQVIVGNRSQLVVTIALSNTTTSPSAGTSTAFAITAAPAATGNAITSVVVDFGDGSKQTYPGNTTSVQHIYAAGGSYTVTAVATDSSTSSGTASVSIFVSAITASFTATASSTPRTINFDASASSSTSTITSYSWNFGDQTNGSGQTPTHLYGTGTTFTVTLTVTDSSSRTNTASKQITVQ